MQIICCHVQTHMNSRRIIRACCCGLPRTHTVITESSRHGSCSMPDAVMVQVRRTDVLAAWSGIRPLATDPNAHDTASASRDHVATVDPDGMLTITGKLA